MMKPRGVKKKNQAKMMVVYGNSVTPFTTPDGAICGTFTNCPFQTTCPTCLIIPTRATFIYFPTGHLFKRELGFTCETSYPVHCLLFWKPTKNPP